MSVIPLDNGDIVMFRNPADGKMQVNLSRGGVRDVAYLSEVEFLAPSALELQGYGYKDTNALIRFSGKRTSLTFKDVKDLRAFKSEVDSARRAMGFHKPEVLRTQPTQPPTGRLNITGGVPVGAPPGAAPGRSPLAANGVAVRKGATPCDVAGPNCKEVLSPHLFLPQSAPPHAHTAVDAGRDRILLEESRHEVQRLQREKEDMQRQMECCVCLTLMESKQVLVPCGHVLCGECAHLCDKCPRCRVQVDSRINLYL